MNEKWKKKLANAANNDDYVKLNTGLMRVSDLNNYLSSFPSNLLALLLINWESLHIINNCRE